MAKTLTVRSVENTKPGKQRREIPDAYMPGLYLIVQPSGLKSWAARYRFRGQSRKLTLGTYPAIDLKAARELAAKALRAVAAGRDPAQEKTQRPAKADSIEAIVSEFVEKHCQRENKPRTAAETERLLRSHVLPRWRSRQVHSIIRRDVLDLIDRITNDVSAGTAGSVFAAVRKCFAWCVERDIIQASPCQGVKRPGEIVERDRTLSDAEIKLVWQAAEALGGPFGRLVKLLVLTGARRDEAARMEWAELDLDARTWTLPPGRVKNSRRHVIPLSDGALAILQATPRIKNSRWVLTTSGEAPASNFAKNKRLLDALLPASMPPWRLHDARRTAASGMQRLGVDLPVIERALNHISGSFAGIVAIYQRHDFAPEVRHAFEAWGGHVADLVAGKATDNVVTLAPAADRKARKRRAR